MSPRSVPTGTAPRSAATASRPRGPRARTGRTRVMVVNAESAVQLAGPWSHRTVSANGTRFHIAEAGDGPLVLMLHGFPEFWWTWRHQLTWLPEAGFRAVAVDPRGYGGAGKPPRGGDPPPPAPAAARPHPGPGGGAAAAVGRGRRGALG